MTSVRVVSTPVGEARIHIDRAKHPLATLVLCHGAGKGVDARDLVALAAALPRRDVNVFRLEQPWVIAGRRVAPRPETLDVATVACLDAIRIRSPLVVGGRSAGARSACRVGRRMGAVACLALAFPLHPPGRPDRTRAGELRGAALPTLVVQGERDAFGSPTEFPDSTRLAVVPDADHGFAVPARSGLDEPQTMALIVSAVHAWIVGLVA